MNNKKYIMVGAPIISKEIFRNVLRPLDNYNFIPNGGFWASDYINEFEISAWNKYLEQRKEIADAKDTTQSTIFTLKEDAKILTIETANDILELSKKYPSYHHILGYIDVLNDKKICFDFEMLSKDYDGIYVNYKNIYHENKNFTFDQWEVNTLLLFNLDCIKEYQIAPITNEYGYSYIKEKEISIPLHVEEESYEHKVLSNISNTIYQELMSQYNIYTFEDYTEYFKKVMEESRKVIDIMLKQELPTIKKIESYLQSKGMNITDKRIITNIVQNNITNYLIEDINRIKTLPKSKTKALTWY